LKNAIAAKNKNSARREAVANSNWNLKVEVGASHNDTTPRVVKKSMPKNVGLPKKMIRCIGKKIEPS